MHRKIQAILLLCLALAPSFVEAGSIRIRAREHFDFYHVRYSSVLGSADYNGMSNTINVWWEDPKKFSFGLAFNPVLGSADISGIAPLGTGDKVTLWSVGLEAKYFVWQDANSLLQNVFTRGGLFFHVFDTDGPLGNLLGTGLYAGTGIEVPVWIIGLSLELAFRGVLLEKSTQLFAATPSIGVHFYF